MRSPLPSRTRGLPTALNSVAFVAMLWTAASCGGGGTEPVAVATVAITAPAAPPAFQTLGRTLQFTAEARDASNALLSTSITWQSSNLSVATISGTGLLTAAGNGTTNITATSGGVTSTAVVVSVNQAPASVVVNPTTVAFGAVGSTRQLTAAVLDSGGAGVTPLPAVTWSRAGSGAAASVSATGLVTAVAPGIGDTAVATLGIITGRAPITVTQVPASILVDAASHDTLRTTGRTRQYTATVRDSQLNVFASAITWSTQPAGIATISTDGLATVTGDGDTQVRAVAGPALGTRALNVRRYASLFTLTPPTATITTNSGTTDFTGAAEDSAAVPLSLSWVSRGTGIATLSSTSAATVTATATGNGTTYIVLSGGTRSDSSQLTVSGQILAPLTATVTVGDFFFRSDRNNTQNQAVDTVRVGGTVTWNWIGSVQHNVNSTGTPSFVSGPLQSAGTLNRTFNAAGSYQYFCQVHATMTGTIVVR